MERQSRLLPGVPDTNERGEAICADSKLIHQCSFKSHWPAENDISRVLEKKDGKSRVFIKRNDPRLEAQARRQRRVNSFLASTELEPVSICWSFRASTQRSQPGINLGRVSQHSSP